ncbi:MAG TPA: LysR substrate-binding domain-containing protein [Pseudoxanthomonas sp.]|uniref:LysR family transcriptional regulator n=1 Tax=Pseudoxanthomonas helianthi TaxID=1453541 RepID=A0A940X4F6_9GAMM|nr:LysR family transcriptional regulator [Pseudoxanthomonas helianthi]MBP3985310.1 LysR family transcriptional regulator [Pseudoxanthomonas helianthi]HWU70715.1 LysR substrate-binding domain-containing protein [Pseudoxanthomonas sp.]
MSHDLNDTLIFVKVVEHGSFISAAKSLRLPKTTVSRKVQELEARLGAQLLHRTTRKLGLTEAGNVYFEHCQRIAQALGEAESAVGQLQSGPRGWLRFTAPYSIGIDKIAPLLGEFHARHPEVRVEMLLSNEPLDLIDKEIDVALRGGSLPDSNLIARKLATFGSQVYASSSYIARHGEPLHPDDLRHHRSLAMSKYRRNNGYYWPLSNGAGEETDFPVSPVLVANDPGALKGALLCGEGLMLGADVMVKPFIEQGLVQRVLAGWTGPTWDFNAVFPRGQGQSPKVRAFIDFLVERLNFEIDYMQAHCPVFLAQQQARDAAAAGLRIIEDALA